MWYEIKLKQQKKMPKVRANINVYSSTRFSGLIFEDEKTVPYDDDASLFRATERPIHAKTELKHKERGTQHCQRVFAKVRF